jgi:hypothetical protein
MDEMDGMTSEDGICQTRDDIYRTQARRKIYRLIPDFFVKHKVTVIEVLHRADMLAKLENAGMYLQQAMQKIAVARSSADGTPVQETIRELDRLINAVYARVFDDKRDDVFPEVKAEGFGPLAVKLASAKDGAYIFNGALARNLRDCSNWNEKTVRLTKLTEMYRREAPGYAFVRGAADEVLAEILLMSSALQDIIGEKENFGEALLMLINIFLGKEQTGQYGEGQGAARLARLFSVGELPLARRSLGERIVAEIYSLKRLRIDSYDTEMKLFRQVTDLAMRGIGPFMSREELIPALELRAKRFIEPECLKACLAMSTLPDEQIEWLFFAEGNIVGLENKLTLYNTIMRLVVSKAFVAQFQSSRIPILKRLHRLAKLNALARSSGFGDNSGRKIANILDIAASDLADQSKLFEAIDTQSSDAAEKAIMLIKLLAAGTFTEPRLAKKAREAVTGYAVKPGFVQGYIDNKLRTSGDELDEGMATSELTELLRKIGVQPETCLKSAAA